LKDFTNDFLWNTLPLGIKSVRNIILCDLGIKKNVKYEINFAIG